MVNTSLSGELVTFGHDPRSGEGDRRGRADHPLIDLRGPTRSAVTLGFHRKVQNLGPDLFEKIDDLRNGCIFDYDLVMDHANRRPQW